MNGDSDPKRIIRIEEGQHYLLEPDDELPLRLLRNLGQGGCSNVEEVVDLNTGRVFARKVFRVRGSAAERRRIFHNEILVIQRLAPHHHITRIFATYVGKREVGILLTPVADGGSLDKFLDDAHEGLLTQSEMNTLDYAFGCLASGLQFMHAQKVRHKDIKPHNILVHKGSFIYTDFGSSLDYGADTRSDTTGHPDSITRKYAAPEVHNSEPRNRKSDVFSLGCVYFEILCALELDPMKPDMHHYADNIIEAIEHMAGRISPQIWPSAVIYLTCHMLNHTPSNRPSAEDVLNVFWKGSPDLFCNGCVRSGLLQVPQDGKAASALAPAAPTHDMMRFLISPETFDETALSALAPYIIRNPRSSVQGYIVQSIILNHC